MSILFNTVITATVGRVYPIVTDTTSLIAVELIRKENDKEVSENFSINLTNEVATRIAIDDIKLAFPGFIGKSQTEVLRALLRGNLTGQTVEYVRTPQSDGAVNEKTKQPYYNLRLRSGLKDATDDQIDTLLAGLGFHATGSSGSKFLGDDEKIGKKDLPAKASADKR